MVTAAWVVDELFLRGVIQEEERLLAASCASQALEWVGNYIHREVPEGLLYTCVSLAAALVEDGKTSLGEEGKISSVSEGDTTISYRDTFGKAVLSAVAANHYAQLNRYRKGLFA